MKENISHETDNTSQKRKKPKFRSITLVSTLHYIRLVYRSAMFIILVIGYIVDRIQGKKTMISRIESFPVIIWVVWLIFVIEMILRFFPSKLESPGCQKQFARNYIKSGEVSIRIEDNNSAVLILIVWISFNLIFGALHMAGIFDDEIMILLCSAYSVCDMICILFFCPFQSWFMKNKCCSSCRIYNWDYAMMFTPLFFLKRSYLWVLLLLSLILMIRWEITFFRHPERFSENTNEYLHCVNCTEKLCIHKNQLHRLWIQIESFTAKRLSQLKK